MFLRTTTALLVAVSHVAWAQSNNDGCQELTDPTLCGSPSSVLVPPDVCASGEFAFEPMPPCCRVQSESKPCQNPPPESGSVCRSVEIGAPSCPPDDNAFCSIEAMKLKLSLSFQHSNRTCCDKCTCYGDPHCEAFDGTPDTWVICDARNAQPGKKHCPMDPSICATQTDHLGRTCKWQTNGNGASWVVAIQGSPCIPTTWNPPPIMLMYQADDFRAELTMGERSIITNIIISDGGNQYVLEASDCFKDATLRNPWRVNVGDRDPPEDIPDWLPDTWVWSPMDGGDILWSVFGLHSNIDLTIRCTRTVERRGARTVYSQPRLNIEQLIEPMNWRGDDPNAIARTNVDGFCATGKINTQGSTDVTERIERLGLCQLTSDELDVAKLLCSPGTTRPGITACKFNWCKSVRADWENCYNEVQSTGWATAWCAAHTTISKQSKDCAANANCKRCQTDMGDFGWLQAIKEWSGTQISEGDCVTRDDLPLDLVDCQSGVRIQFEAAPDQWVTYVAVPSTVVLCNGGLEFDSQADAPLFSNRVRVQQCSMPHGCLSDKCMSEVGFSASFQYESVKNEQAQIVDLYQAGVLVCDPVLYPNDPTGCLTVQPPAMCPCPGEDGGGGGRRALRSSLRAATKKGSARS